MPAKPEAVERTSTTSVRTAAACSATNVPPTAAGAKGNRVWEGHQLGSRHTTPYLHRGLQSNGHHILGLFD